jgi:replicative DNA helicase
MTNAQDPRPDETVLPWACEAEQCVLGALLIDPTAYDRAADLLRRQDFFDAGHGQIWDAISSLVLACKPVDVLTVFDRLGAKAEEVGGLPYLNAISQSVPSAANLRRYAEIVREKAMHRALMQTADEALEVARGDGSFEDKSDRIGSLFATVRDAGQRSKPLFVHDMLAARVDHYNALAQGEVEPGISTGLQGLDDALGGGMRPGKVIVLAARPGVGKTSLAQQILLYAAEHSAAVGAIFSQEMERTELLDRAVSNLGAIGYGRLLNGKLTNPEWTRLGEAVDKLARLPFAIDDQSALTLHDIRTKAFGIKGLRLLVIDYVQLCAAPKGSPRNSTRNDVLTEISRGIKALAKDLGLTVLLLSQLSRDVEKRQNPEPTLADLRESGAIEQDADVVAFLHRVREYDSHRLIACTVPKNRQGKPGSKFGLDFEGHYQRWRDSAEKLANHNNGGGFSSDAGFS